MKWFAELPDCWKTKPDKIAGPCHHFDVELVKHDQQADKNCPMCQGRGCYTSVHIGEYDETPVSVKCACTQN